MINNIIIIYSLQAVCRWLNWVNRMTTQACRGGRMKRRGEALYLSLEDREPTSC